MIRYIYIGRIYRDHATDYETLWYQRENKVMSWIIPMHIYITVIVGEDIYFL